MPNTKPVSPKIDVEEQFKLAIEETNKEMGLFLPKNLSPQMTEVWEEFFDILRFMYRFDVIYLQYVKKYLYDFFEIAKGQSDELLRKKNAVQNMYQKAKVSVEKQKEIMVMFYQEKYIEEMENFYEDLATEEERIEFLEMIYEGNLPPEIQEIVDDYEFSKLSPEEIDEIQGMALAEATSKYQGKGGLNLGKTGTVITAGEIAEFIDSNGDGANDLEEPAITRKPRTLPNLPNGNFSQKQSQNSNQPQQNKFQNQPNNQPNRQQGTNNIANSTQNQQPVNNQMPNNQNSQPANNIAPFANNKFEKLRNLPK